MLLGALKARHFYSTLHRYAASALVALVGFTTSVPAHADIPIAEWVALNWLYTHAGGSTWTNKTGWQGPRATACSWYGVTCDATETHVISIILSSNNLTGYL